MIQTIITQPIYNILIFIYTTLPIKDLGLSIIILTCIIKFLLWPLNKKAIRSQQQMQQLQPAMEKIKEKYKDE